MNTALFILLMIQSMYTYGLSRYGTELCDDFTLGYCSIPDDVDSYPTKDVVQCQNMCQQLDDCNFFTFDRNSHDCFFLSENYRSECDLVGASVETPIDICRDPIANTCNAFDEENCYYLGHTVQNFTHGVNDPFECQAMCQVLYDGGNGCNFWVYNIKEHFCSLKKTSDRTCTRASGPRAPSINNCDFWTTTTPKPNCAFGTEFMGQCYELVERIKDWSAAFEDCHTRGGALASIRDERINHYLDDLTPKNVWIGGTDTKHEGQWMWPDGGPINYTNWSEDEPNGGNHQNCMVQFGSGGKWGDGVCKSFAPYICQFPVFY